MNGPSEASHLLRMARKDLQAMHALSDPSVADVETFGFHAQQAYDETEEPFDRPGITTAVERLLRQVESLLPPEPPC